MCSAFGLGDADRVSRGSRRYWRGRLPLGDDEYYELVVAQAADMANIDAALLANDTVRDWQPGAMLLVGIAAAAKTDQQLGDVVVASDVAYYERGKSTPNGVLPEPKRQPADATLWGQVSTVADWTDPIPVPRPDRHPTRPSIR